MGKNSYVCEKCSKVFTRKHKKQKYCSVDCYLGRFHRTNQDGDEEKQCTKCKEWKPLSFEYYQHASSSTNGFSGYCKLCISVKQKTPEVAAYRKKIRSQPHVKEKMSRYEKEKRALPKYKDRDRSGEREYESQQRGLLTDRIVKRGIYIASKGKITYDQMTPEMIVVKRVAILEHRANKESGLTKNKLNTKKGPFCCKCDVCGIDFISKQSKGNKCSKECATKKMLERLRDKYKEEWTPPPPFECQWCGKMHQPEYRDTRTKYCSSTCEARAGRGGHHGGSSIRRLVAESRGERFQRVKIFERDQWICQICHKEVELDLKYPHIMSASIDHIIPIVCGGLHTRDNVQLAHLSCNINKGVGEIKPLKMFG